VLTVLHISATVPAFCKGRCFYDDVQQAGLLSWNSVIGPFMLCYGREHFALQSLTCAHSITMQFFFYCGFDVCAFELCLPVPSLLVELQIAMTLFEVILQTQRIVSAS